MASSATLLDLPTARPRFERRATVGRERARNRTAADANRPLSFRCPIGTDGQTADGEVLAT